MHVKFILITLRKKNISIAFVLHIFSRGMASRKFERLYLENESSNRVEI